MKFDSGKIHILIGQNEGRSGKGSAMLDGNRMNSYEIFNEIPCPLELEKGKTLGHMLEPLSSSTS